MFFLITEPNSALTSEDYEQGQQMVHYSLLIPLQLVVEAPLKGDS